MPTVKFSIKIFEAICEDIATSSKGLKHICVDHGVTSRTFYRWITADEKKREEGKKHRDLRHKYTRAREEQAEMLADEIIAIADDGSQDTIKVYNKAGEEVEVEDKEWTNRSKLRVEARKWTAAKLKPRKYGDKIDVTSDGEKIQPVDLTSIISGFMEKDEGDT